MGILNRLEAVVESLDELRATPGGVVELPGLHSGRFFDEVRVPKRDEVLRREGDSPGEELVGQTAERVDVGAMIDLHFWPTPNGWKITIALEEMELPYRVVPVNIGRGDQFTPEFLAISPNNRMPAIVDHDVEGEPVTVFESGAIAVYLASDESAYATGSVFVVDGGMTL